MLLSLPILSSKKTGFNLVFRSSSLVFADNALHKNRDIRYDFLQLFFYVRQHIGSEIFVLRIVTCIRF